jgi:putative membrane protein
VKEFGEQMVTDHTKANDELQAVAAKKNVTLPTDLDAKQAAVRDRLAKESSKKFDRAYMAAMVTDHKEDVAEFERASKSSDPDVKAFAAKTLPTLREHLKMAKQVQATL